MIYPTSIILFSHPKPLSPFQQKAYFFLFCHDLKVRLLLIRYLRHCYRYAISYNYNNKMFLFFRRIWSSLGFTFTWSLTLFEHGKADEYNERKQKNRWVSRIECGDGRRGKGGQSGWTQVSGYWTRAIGGIGSHRQTRFRSLATAAAVPCSQVYFPALSPLHLSLAFRLCLSVKTTTNLSSDSLIRTVSTPFPMWTAPEVLLGSLAPQPNNLSRWWGMGTVPPPMC